MRLSCQRFFFLFFKPGRQSTIDIQSFKLQSLTGEAEIVYDRTPCERGAVYISLAGFVSSPGFSFSSGASLEHTARRKAGITIMYLYTAIRYFSRKKLTNVMAG